MKPTLDNMQTHTPSAPPIYRFKAFLGSLFIVSFFALTGTSVLIYAASCAAHGWLNLENHYLAKWDHWKGESIAWAAADEGYTRPKLSKTEARALVISEAKLWGNPVNWVRCITTTESGYNPHAVSNQGAIGVMQVLASNADSCGLTPEELLDTEKNTICGNKMLAEARRLSKGDLKLASRIYHGGAGALKKPGPKSIKYGDTVMACKTKLDTIP